jgi:hypothetical protein
VKGRLWFWEEICVVGEEGGKFFLGGMVFKSFGVSSL